MESAIDRYRKRWSRHFNLIGKRRHQNRKKRKRMMLSERQWNKHENWVPGPSGYWYIGKNQRTDWDRSYQ